MELGPSRWAKHTLLKSAKIFHYRQVHSENFPNFIFCWPTSDLDQMLTKCQPYILIRTWCSWFLMSLIHPKRCGTSVRSFSTHFRAEISVMCQKTKVSALWKRLFFSFKPGSNAPAGCLRRTPHRKCVFFLKPGCDAPAGCLRRIPYRKLTLF